MKPVQRPFQKKVGGGWRAPQRAATPPSGLAARDLAVSAIYSVIVDRRAFDDAFARAAETRPMAPRDRAFARAIASAALRRHGELKAVITRFLQKPLPERQGRLDAILLSAAAQLLILKSPPHAAISLAVDQCHNDTSAQRFAKLVNAVLRRVSVEGEAIVAGLDLAALNVPSWLYRRWQGAYGAEDARRIALASMEEPALDLTVKADPARWAGALGGIVLPTGSVRLADAGRIEELAGFAEGEWWVQDAAAALPVKLLGDVAGQAVLDVCAAPGGKTAQLATAGARVTALDKSAGRLKRLLSNLERLQLSVETAVGDAATYAPSRAFDAILVDAPCTATGTIRRHPDILHLKRPEDVASLAAVQARILARSADLLRPGGRLVYCTCSLEADEGPKQIAAFLSAQPRFRRLPVVAGEAGIDPTWLTDAGDVRTLPFHVDELAEGLRGLDGFYIARLEKSV